MTIHERIRLDAGRHRKSLAVLIDPDKCGPEHLKRIFLHSGPNRVDYFLLGGSLITQDNLDTIIDAIRRETEIPVLLFPGSNMQLSPKAHGILLLSLISGRNPDLLIGRHILAAPFLKSSNIEVIPTGYMLVESGRVTTVAYMSNTSPIPSDKEDVAMCTALAGEFLGMKLIYLDAGSGAGQPVPAGMIRAVGQAIGTPLAVGGGITQPASAILAWEAGADIVVVGNAFEKDPGLIPGFADARDSVNQSNSL